ncbi:sialate O-acetylesterase [Persicitalea jodogahamensis]|uniref:9-O-acetylesterase n=1 Tax=Persicitalea jodogahamensis TaxID=402147 RepID=A0A8J3GCK2_9BACT|nr:sialate O-acetylesterase [Persicitalea jodogahamensis]GHB85271.1 9-O-acetylesterase [Persicitalea jodogahamensis]
MLKKTIIPIFFLLLTTTLATAQLKVARIFGDHMVLQREKPVQVWGWADKGDKVELTFNQQKATAKADANGKWMAELPAMPAGGPYELVVKTRKDEVKLTDILVGEVWLLSGQSNMEWRVKNSDSAKVEIARANYPNIRHFEVAHELAFTPEKDLNSGDWKIASPATVGDFSAVGYFFARDLVQQLGVPVGLVHSSWGGSQIEGWISEKAMRESDVLNYYPETMARSWDDDAKKQEKKLITQAYGSADFDPQSVDESKYLSPDYDFNQWKIQVNPQGQWVWQGIGGYRGTAFIERTVEIPAEMANTETTLHFGRNTGDLIFYINGKKVFEGSTQDAIALKLPAGTWRSGKNALLVKLGPMREPAYFGMGFMGSPADFSVKGAGQSLPLVDERWKMVPSLKSPRTYDHFMNNVGTTIYNAMIAPLIPYTIAGALWYQGETNAGRAYQYRKSFPLLIESWRKDWGYDFPFLFVQLATYGPFQNSNEGSDWAELREAQTMTLSLPKTGMAVTTDIGNPDNIHPTNKQDVGHRLALAAMKIAYGKDDIVFSGPTLKEVQFSGQKAIISFDHVGGGLMVKEKYGYLKGFEIAGRDHTFYYAPARIEGDKVVVSHPDVPEPVAVRYGWANSPIDNNLFNAEGLPAVPFRTDDWKGKTEGGKFQ